MGGAVLNKSSLKEGKSSGWWWLLIGWAVPGQGENLPSSFWSSKVVALSAPNCKVSCNGRCVCENSPYRASWFHFKWSFPLLILIGSISLFCMWLSCCSSTICWKDYSFPIELSSYPFQKLIDDKFKGLFLDSILFQIYTSVFMPRPHCID